MFKFGFIGSGNMGYSMMKGLIDKYSIDDITFNCKTEKNKVKINNEVGIKHQNNNVEVAKNSKYIILAVKPYMYNDILNEILKELNEDKIVISIAPGITIKRISETIGNKSRIVRVMPNTPVLVKEGMSLVSYIEEDFSQEEINEIHDMLSSFGKVKALDEKYIDMAMPVTGSSPAYVYMMIEALADGAVKLGLDRETSYEVIAQAVLGSAKMVLETGKHPAELKDNVCSPGGTTIEAVKALEDNGFRSALINAVEENYKKSQRLE